MSLAPTSQARLLMKGKPDHPPLPPLQVLHLSSSSQLNIPGWIYVSVRMQWRRTVRQEPATRSAIHTAEILNLDPHTHTMYQDRWLL